VLASIAESDQRAPTNILQNKIYGSWKIRSNTVANITFWRGRVLNTFLQNNAALYNNWGEDSSARITRLANLTGTEATFALRFGQLSAMYAALAPRH